MKKYPFYCLLLLWLAGSANTFIPGTTLTKTAHTLESKAAEGCYLASPTGLQVTVITPVSISLEWNGVPGAAYYRIRFWDKVNKDMVVNYLQQAKPGLNTTTAGDLVPGVTYSISVSPVCANGQDSL